jgi:hypothetical protein
MVHVESSEQAVARLRDSAVRHERTVRRADGDKARIRRADLHYLMTAHNTRRQVRHNGGIDHIERAVLGTSGSPELLERFKELAKDIGGKAGEPVVVVEARQDEGVQQAVVGELNGSLHVYDSFSSGKDGKGVMRSSVSRPHQKAILEAGTEPLLRFVRDEGDWRISAVSEVRRLSTHVSIAEIGLDEIDPHDDLYDDPEARFVPEQEVAIHDHVADGAVLLGGEAIKGSELFESDLKMLISLSDMSV